MRRYYICVIYDPHSFKQISTFHDRMNPNKRVFTILSLRVVVVVCRHDNSRKNSQIEMLFGLLYQGSQSQKNQPYPTKISKIRAFVVFFKNPKF